MTAGAVNSPVYASAPDLAALDQGDGDVGHAVLQAESDAGFGRRTNRVSLLLGQASVAVLLSLAGAFGDHGTVTPLRDHVVGVVSRCTREKVTASDAERLVAAVKDLLTSGDLAVSETESYAMGELKASTFASVRYDSIAVAAGLSVRVGTCPDPAPRLHVRLLRSVLVHLRPKTLGERWPFPSSSFIHVLSYNTRTSSLSKGGA